MEISKAAITPISKVSADFIAMLEINEQVIVDNLVYQCLLRLIGKIAINPDINSGICDYEASLRFVPTQSISEGFLIMNQHAGREKRTLRASTIIVNENKLYSSSINPLYWIAELLPEPKNYSIGISKDDESIFVLTIDDIDWRSVYRSMVIKKPSSK